jgi:tight adherence protein C
MDALTVTAPLWFFLFTFAFFAAVYIGVERGNHSVLRRLHQVAVKFRAGQVGYNQHAILGGGIGQNLLTWAERQMPAPNLKKPSVAKLVNTIQHAGFYSPSAPNVFQAIRFGVTVGVGVIGYVLALVVRSSSLTLIFTGAAIGYLAPLYCLRALARSRQARIRREVADVIDLLVVCVECGLGLLASIRIVGRECEHHGRIMGGQLRMLSGELSAGASIGDGLHNIAQRTGVDDIRTFASILIQSEKLGTEMAQAMRATADQLRVKRSMRAEEMAQKLPIKMVFPLIFLLLPAIMIILIGPEMIQIFRSFNFHGAMMQGVNIK